MSLHRTGFGIRTTAYSPAKPLSPGCDPAFPCGGFGVTVFQSSTMSTRVYLLESQSLLSGGLRAALKDHPEITLTGRTNDPVPGVSEIARHRVDVVVVDELLGWKILGGLIPEVIRLPGRPRVLVVAGTGTGDGPRQAAEAGAAGYLPSTSTAAALADAVFTVAVGKLAFLPEHLPGLLGSVREAGPGDRGLLGTLTDREREVFRHTGEGLEAKAIGRRLGISGRTVDVHRANIRNKLGISGTHELMIYAVQVFELERLAAQLAAFCRERRPLLMVEDDEVDVLSVRRALRDLQAEPQVISVGNGEEALVRLRCRNQPRPFLILLDINMPRMNGIEFLTEFRRDDSLASIPVAVLTSSPHEADKERMHRLGVIGYHIKPTSSRDYVDLFRDLAQYWGRNALPSVPVLAAA